MMFGESLMVCIIMFLYNYHYCGPYIDYVGRLLKIAQEPSGNIIF